MHGASAVARLRAFVFNFYLWVNYRRLLRRGGAAGILISG